VITIVRDPQLRNKLDKGIFRNNDVFQSYYSDEKEDWVYEDRTGCSYFVVEVLSRELWGLSHYT
jgi:hypothetical protein